MSIFTGLTTGVYKYIAIAGIALGLAVGGFFYGKHIGNLQAQVAIANFKVTKQDDLADMNSIEIHTVYKILTRYVTNTVHIKDTGAVNDQVISKYVPDHEPLSIGWVSVYNSSITGSLATASSAANATPSGLTAAEALTGINDNNVTCLNYKETAVGLQAYISGYNAAVTKANADVLKKK